MKKPVIIGGVVAALIIIGVIVAFATHSSPSNTPSQTATSSGSTPAKNSSQVLPVSSNPIRNTSTQPGLGVTNAMVENNTDPKTGKPVADKLQFTIKNTSSKPMNNLKTYYTMTDVKTHKSESYFQKLTGITLAPGQSTTVYFYDSNKPHYYPENKYSIYRTSTNKVNFKIEVSAPGFQPAFAHVQKGANTGENLNR